MIEKPLFDARSLRHYAQHVTRTFSSSKHRVSMSINCHLAITFLALCSLASYGKHGHWQALPGFSPKMACSHLRSAKPCCGDHSHHVKRTIGFLRISSMEKGSSSS